MSVDTINIGIFAYNEENTICNILRAVVEQSIFNLEKVKVKCFVLANGCTDSTVPYVRRLISEKKYSAFELVNFDEGGKSRTWNKFVHDISEPHTDYFIFIDSDISFPNTTTLEDMYNNIRHNPNLSVFSSKPVKDIEFKQNLTFAQKLIMKSAGTLNEWKQSICGQLYIAKSATVRGIHLPVGLPVEDGYIRAMIATDNMSKSENLSYFDGKDEIFHIYTSETKISQLIKHQVRIVIGSSINAIIYQYLRSNASDNKTVRNDFSNEYFLKNLLKRMLPSIKYGWVPWSFLFKRSIRLSIKLRKQPSLKTLLLLIIGFCFDALVYIIAQYKMARGTGIGHW